MVFLHSLARWATAPVVLTLVTVGSLAETPPSVSATVLVKQPVANAAFTRGPDYVFTADTKAKVKRAAVQQLKAYGATVAPDGVTFFIDSPRNGKSGGLLVSKKNPGGAFFATPEVHDVVFSPGSKYVSVLDDETLKVTVLSVPEGKVIKQFSGAYLARFRSDTLFQYRTVCQLYEVNLTGEAAAREVGPKLCGGADAAADGSVWIVAQPSGHGRVLSLRSFTTLTQIDGVTGNTNLIPAGNSFYDPSVSPAGKRICYGSNGRLSCYQLDTKTVDTLGSLDPARLDWEQNDQLMLGASRSEIFTLNFADRTTRKLIDLEGIRYWRFFPGGTRVYVYQMGSKVLDLETSSSIEIYGKKVEVGGFVPVPGRTDRFMTGNEVGSSRVHYWVDVTSSKASADANAKPAAASTAKPSTTAANSKTQAAASATSTGVKTGTATSTKTQGTASTTTVNTLKPGASSATATSTKTQGTSKAPAISTKMN